MTTSMLIAADNALNCSWQEALVFESVAHVGVVLIVEVMQEERVRSSETQTAMSRTL